MQIQTEILDRHECMHLLAHQSFLGRVAFVVDGQPHVLPVNYVADGESVVFATAPGMKLRALQDGARVAFEVDETRPHLRAGWSVHVLGTAFEITDEQELDRLRSTPLHSWAIPSPEHWVRIRISEISGRRIPGG